MLRPNLTRISLLLVLLAALPACGVEFHDSFDGTELFRTIRLDGDRIVGSELTLTVGVTQGYPAPVQVGCYYELDRTKTTAEKRFSLDERGTKVGEALLTPSSTDDPAKPGGQPQNLTFRFSAPQPGAYELACITTSATDNGLTIKFTIAPS